MFDCRWCIPKEDGLLVANYSSRCVTKHYRINSDAEAGSVQLIAPIHNNFEDSLALLELAHDQQEVMRGALHSFTTAS